MPKVEPEFVEECESGRRVVPLSDLDRANAEIERLETLTKKLGVLVSNAWKNKEVSFETLRIHIAADGTVTEIDRG